MSGMDEAVEAAARAINPGEWWDWQGAGFDVERERWRKIARLAVEAAYPHIAAAVRADVLREERARVAAEAEAAAKPAEATARCAVAIVRQDPWIMGDYHREACGLPVKAGEAYCPHHLRYPASGQLFQRSRVSR